MDNNLFRTKIIRQLGGFPSNCLVCSDSILVKKIVYETPYKWITDVNVVSDHIKQNIKAYIKHTNTLSKLCARTPYCVNPGSPSQPPLLMLRLFLTSPLRALIIAYKKRCPKLLYVYPAIRYQCLKACIEAKLF
jgi:hypothetical protein